MVENRNFWEALKELDFLSAFFSWLFMLLTRLAEPFMLIATLYVIAETGIPAVASVVAHNLAIGVMITAPEVLLPGAFVVAAKAKEKQRRQATLLFVVCWLFILLTLATLFDLFLLHLTGVGLAVLMFARCAVAVAYSIIMRVMSHGVKSSALFLPNVPDISALISQISAHFLSKADAELLQRSQAEISAKLDRFVPKSRPILCEHFGAFPVSPALPAIASQVTHAAFALVEFGVKVEQKEEEALFEQPKESEVESGTDSQKYLMTFEEAAQYTGYSIATLNKQLKAGEIEASANGKKLKIKSLKIKPGTTGHMPALRIVSGRSA